MPRSSAKASPLAVPTAWPTGPLHVLIVAQDPGHRAQLVAQLAPQGHTVHATESVPDAIRRARYIYYQVVVLAFPLSDPPAPQVLAELHALSPDSELVVLAGPEQLPGSLAADVLGVVTLAPAGWADERLVLIVAQAVERQRLRRRLAALDEVAYAVAQFLDLPRLLEFGLDRTLEATGCAAGVVYLLDEHLSQYVLQCSRGLSPAFVEGAQTVQVVGGLHTQALADRQPLRVESFPQAGRRSGFARRMEREGIRSGVIVPLYLGDQALGTLSVLSRDPHDFSDEDLRVLISISQHLGVAVAHSRLHARERTAREQLTALLLTVQEQAEEVRGLSGRVVRAQEAERQHIARELHDGIGQVLTALRIDLGLISDLLRDDPAAAAARLAEAREHVGRLMNDVRQISAELRPGMLDDLGLVPTLQWLTDSYARRLGIPVTCEAQDWPEACHPDVEIAIFRIVQEALNNAVKHAGARRIAVRLSGRGGEARLAVEDDGRGFDADAVLHGPADRQGTGLRSMRDRVQQLAGEFAIDSQPQAGTRLRVRIPLPRTRAPESRPGHA